MSQLLRAPDGMLGLGAIEIRHGKGQELYWMEPEQKKLRWFSDATQIKCWLMINKYSKEMCSY